MTNQLTMAAINNNSYLPDLELFGMQEADIPKTCSRAPLTSNNVVPINQIADLVSNIPSVEGKDFADHLVTSAFQQQFCNKLFDLLGGFVC